MYIELQKGNPLRTSLCTPKIPAAHNLTILAKVVHWPKDIAQIYSTFMGE